MHWQTELNLLAEDPGPDSIGRLRGMRIDTLNDIDDIEALKPYYRDNTDRLRELAEAREMLAEVEELLAEMTHDPNVAEPGLQRCTHGTDWPIESYVFTIGPRQPLKPGDRVHYPEAPDDVGTVCGEWVRWDNGGVDPIDVHGRLTDMECGCSRVVVLEPLDHLPGTAEVAALAEVLTDGVTEDFVVEAGGLLAFADGCAEGGCACEPCSLCERQEPHELGHDCRDYTCMGCEANDLLRALHTHGWTR